MMDVREMQLAGVPSLVIRKHAGAVGPLVLWYHGWTGHKGDGNPVAAYLANMAQAGCVVICPDAPEHGSRITPALQFRKTFNGWAFICDVMEQARCEVAALLDAALALPNVSGKNPQVGGISMGGLIAQMAFAGDARLVAMVSVVGRSSFFQADAWCREAQEGTRADRWCVQHAPQLHPERYTRGPVLFIDGGLDDDCPPTANALTTQRINAAGGTARQFVDPATGHGFSEIMQAQCLQWICKNAGITETL